MPGLSETERVGCGDILKLLPKADVLSLSDTVTNKMIVVENSTEAAKTILSFTNNAEEFLRRKKVHRDFIFKYLAKEGVVMPPNSEKHLLVKRTLELWTSGQISSLKAIVHKNHQKDTNFPKQRQNTETASTSMQAVDVGGFDPIAFGRGFCSWFFQLLNSQNPSLGQQLQDWGPQHFLPDAKLCLLSRTDSEQKEEFLGANMVSLRLLALTREEHLVFSPNLESCGLKVLVSPHGLVMVAVAGTIHRVTTWLGIFEQVFGLVRSPLENNSWKIKVIHLRIRGQDALAGKEISAPALNYNSSELQLLCS